MSQNTGVGTVQRTMNFSSTINYQMNQILKGNDNNYLRSLSSFVILI